MVPYDESSRKIEEFWKLGHAKGGTDVPPSPGRDSQTSGRTGETVSQDVQGRYRGAGGVEPSLHLKIVWFDLLAVEDEVLLDGEFCPRFPSAHLTIFTTVPFEERRARLTSLVQEITGYVSSCDRPNDQRLTSLITAEQARRLGRPQLRRRISTLGESRCFK